MCVILFDYSNKICYYHIYIEKEGNMKKTMFTTLIIFSVGIALILVGSILQGISWGTGFDGTTFASALNNIGYIVTLLSGVVLMALGISTAIKGGCNCNCPDDCSDNCKCGCKDEKKEGKKDKE